MIVRLHLLPLLLLTPLAAQHDLQFTEVLVDPVGPNSGNQIIELRNLGPIGRSIDGWTLANSTGSATLPNLVVPGYHRLLVHVGASGASTLNDIYLPSLPDLLPADTLSLFRTNQTSNPADLEDFVSWGGNQHGMAVAINGLQWPGTFETVVPPNQEGCTLAHFVRQTFGSYNQASAWFRDCTPTIGAANDAAGMFVENFGCPAITQHPTIGSGAPDNRPWIGETWLLDVYYLPPTPTTIFVAFGFDDLGQMSLAPYGMPGCSFDVQPTGIHAWFMPANSGTIVTQLPNNPVLANLEFRLQGLFLYPGANAANALPTRVKILNVGSR